jgi:DNA mismatch repair ATPase MutS
MVQPIQNAMHLHTVDSLTVGLGKKLLELRAKARKFREDIATMAPNGAFKLSLALEMIDTTDPRRMFALIQDQPERLRILLQDLARLEILWRIAIAKESLQPTRFARDTFILEDARDISLPGDSAVPSHLYLTEKTHQHAVITGPNGGGKSSFMRSILQCVLFSHAYGYAPCAAAALPRFLWIASGLQLRDTPGTYSMFETEVKFAADILRSGRPDGPGLVLFDELFHSTNPPDGIRTAERFLQNLWSQNTLYSIVSTHVFSLIESAPKGVLPVCCPATEGPGGKVTYEFRARPGICKVSSVHTVWDRFGLAAPAPNCGQPVAGNSSPSKRTEDAE